jgi:hypothetical protein
MSKSKSRTQILAAAKLSVFTANPGLPPKAYAAEQMKDRGSAFSIGPFAETGRKLVAAEAVNGVAFVTLSRVKLTEAAKEDVMGYQVVAYDLTGAVLSATPLNDDAPKGESRGWTVYREVKAEVEAQGDILIYAAVKGKHDALIAEAAELYELVELLAPEVSAEEPAPVEA